MTTEAEKKYLEQVAQLPCIACAKKGFNTTPVEVHHIREGVGMAQRASHFDTIPLCPFHHRHGAEAVHVSPETFKDLFGSEEDLVEETRQNVNILRLCRVGG